MVDDRGVSATHPPGVAWAQYHHAASAGLGKIRRLTKRQTEEPTGWIENGGHLRIKLNTEKTA